MTVFIIRLFIISALHPSCYLHVLRVINRMLQGERVISEVLLFNRSVDCFDDTSSSSRATTNVVLVMHERNTRIGEGRFRLKLAASSSALSQNVCSTSHEFGESLDKLV